jgi:rhodanese-related sulfurtransferase
MPRKKNKQRILIVIFFNFTLFPMFLSESYSTDPLYAKMLGTLYKHTVNLIYPADLDRLMRNVKQIYILDTRQKNEFDISHIKGARFIGQKSVDPALISDIPKNAAIIVYCSVGYRSEKAGEKLMKLGYKDVSNLYGGIFEWLNENYEVYNNNSATNEIHGYSKKWSKWLKQGKIVY